MANQTSHLCNAKKFIPASAWEFKFYATSAMMVGGLAAGKQWKPFCAENFSRLTILAAVSLRFGMI
jgi:hypothetical protein